PVFEEDIYEAIDVHTCVDKRNTIGAPGPKAMEQVIAINKKWIKEHEE
ncbi:MAG: argininosuccinate lyase, partial [Anaerobutyricum sp.]